MPDLSIFKTPAPYHIITYGTLLGTQFFQSFVAGITAYKALTRPQFSQLQQKIFPIYFGINTALPVVLALTYPASKLALRESSGLAGVFSDVNRWTVLIPLGIQLVTSVANLLYAGPATTKIMRDRKVQETRDGKKYDDAAPQSDEMKKLNTAFATMHGVSSLLNMVGWLSTMWYGVTLASRLQ